MKVDLLTRRETKFVLWRPKNATTPPKFVIGQFQAGNPPTLVNEQNFNMTGAAGFPNLWEIAATACHLTDDEIYHNWFEIDDGDDEKNPKKPIRIADPAAFTVDWRLLAKIPDSPAYNADDQRHASVILSKQGKQDFGGTRFRYSVPVDNAYDPMSGEKKSLFPARRAFGDSPAIGGDGTWSAVEGKR
jgi:pullulanase